MMAMVTSATAGDDVRGHTRARKIGKSPCRAMAIDVLDNPAKIAAKDPRLARLAKAITTTRQESGARSAIGATLVASAPTPRLPIKAAPRTA